MVSATGPQGRVDMPLKTCIKTDEETAKNLNFSGFSVL
jgi:hypothetical protein